MAGSSFPPAAGSSCPSKAAKGNDVLRSISQNHYHSSFVLPRPYTAPKRAPVASRGTQSNMPDWQDEYRANLLASVQAGYHNKELIDHCQLPRHAYAIGCDWAFVAALTAY